MTAVSPQPAPNEHSAAVPRADVGLATEIKTAIPFVVLASTSPRRRELLTEYGLQFVAVDPQIDDGLLREPPDVLPDVWAGSLAYLKAQAAVRVAHQSKLVLASGCVVLGADTIVVKDKRLLGKPKDAADAAKMLMLLSGGCHRVITGIALVCPQTGRRTIACESAEVTVGALSAEQIGGYVGSGQWAGKAGGYNLFDRVAAGWPISWQGDPTAIVGLPMGTLLRALRRWSATV